MKTIITYCMLLALCLPGGCKKSPKQYNITDQRLIDALSIKKGSYFVYVDSATSVRDSFWSTGFSHSNNLNREETARFEAVGLTITNNTLGDHYGFIAGGQIANMNRIFISSDHKGISFYHADMVKLPFIENSIDHKGDAFYYYAHYHDSFLVNGKNYKDVYETISQESNKIFHSFFSMQNGLIRFIVTTDSSYKVWDLENSFIVR